MLLTSQEIDLLLRLHYVWVWTQKSSLQSLACSTAMAQRCWYRQTTACKQRVKRPLVKWQFKYSWCNRTECYWNVFAACLRSSTRRTTSSHWRRALLMLLSQLLLLMCVCVFAACLRAGKEAERGGLRQVPRHVYWVRQHCAAAARQEQQVPHGEQAAACTAWEERYEGQSGLGRQRGIVALRAALLQTTLHWRLGTHATPLLLLWVGFGLG